MKTTLLLVAILPVLFSGCSNKHIDGEIFIVTKSKDNVRLGLVPVFIYEAETYRAFISGYLDECNKLQDDKVAALKSIYELKTDASPEQIDQLEAERKSLTSSSRLFAHLPKPMETEITDASGHFEFEHLKNKVYFLAAKSERDVGSHKEEYFWVVGVYPPELNGKKLLLSNDNRFSKITDENFTKWGL